jgi:hypothetical protein
MQVCSQVDGVKNTQQSSPCWLEQIRNQPDAIPSGNKPSNAVVETLHFAFGDTVQCLAQLTISAVLRRREAAKALSGCTVRLTAMAIQWLSAALAFSTVRLFPRGPSKHMAVIARVISYVSFELTMCRIWVEAKSPRSMKWSRVSSASVAMSGRALRLASSYKRVRRP